LNVQDARVDDRARQQAARARNAMATATTAATATSGCHEQASDEKRSGLMKKVLESFDSTIAMSRAGLHRKLGAILRGSARSAAASEPVKGVLSRAGLGA
jgi:hypothetical protein